MLLIVQLKERRSVVDCFNLVINNRLNSFNAYLLAMHSATKNDI